MSILWLIIKVILFALLGIVALLLIGLAIILLAPIRYEAYVEKYDELRYDIHVGYLKGIKGSFCLEEGIKNHRVSVFGKILYEEKVEEDKGLGQSPQTKDCDKESLQKDKNNKDALTNKVLSGGDKMHHGADTEYKKQDKKEAVTKKIIKPPVTENIEHTAQEVTEEVKEETKQKVKEMTKSDIKEILLDPLTYRGTKRIIRGIWDILKVIAPKEWDFEIVLGTGDPGDTGELIAKLTLLYPIYYSHGIIRGDYEKECLMGGFLIKGKFRLGEVARHLIQLYLHRDVRAFIHLILK